ncbi:MAG TPA: vanadium-dependent haloperoxidase [Rubrivivax sp.]|nr:vanadium-dependent haloperoxidase [Rubrivivax sp.]
MKRRNFLFQSGAATAAAAWSRPALAAYSPSVIHLWNDTTCSAIATAFNGPTVGARSLAMVFEAVYNAWAAYGSSALFTLSGLRTMPRSEWTTGLKQIAISHAAHTVLNDLYPAQRASFDAALSRAVAGLPTTSRSGIAASQLGQQAGVALLQSRHGDGSNQLNNYADTSGYVPVNTPDAVLDVTRWQPLRVPTASGGTAVQVCLTPHWGNVRPFALASGSALRPVWTPAAPTAAEMNELIELSAALDDRTKCQVDFFANNPGSVTPPGQWMKFCELVSRNDQNSLDRDAILFCMVAQAMLDASIAAWDCKRAFDYIRPISAIRHFYRGQMITAWAGVGGGPGLIRGEDWMPYQRVTSPTPNFAEFVSGHSTFSGAAAGVIAALRGDRINLSFTIPASGIRFDPTVPRAPVVLSWSSLSAVAAAAGMSRRYGGIHFKPGDLMGRELGAKVAKAVLARSAKLVSSDDDDDDDD